MKRYILPITLAAATVCAVAFAQQLPERNGGFAIRLVERRLNITPTQREQLKAVLQAERPTIQQLRDQAEAERTEMDASAAFNETQVRAIANKYAVTNTDILVERARVRGELLAVLTPEQRSKLAQLRAQVRAEFDERLETLGDQL